MREFLRTIAKGIVDGIDDDLLLHFLCSRYGERETVILTDVQRFGDEEVYIARADPSHVFLEMRGLIERNKSGGRGLYAWRCTEDGDYFAQSVHDRLTRGWV